MVHRGGGQRFDVLCVGDVATDVYIALSPDEAQVVEGPDGLRLDMAFGAKLPFDRTVTVEAGGNAANAAVAIARLGLRTALVSYVGGDALGRDILAALHREGIDTSLVRLDHNEPTNKHFVLWLGGERTILVRHEHYDYHWPHLRPSEIPEWLYLSSVGRDTHGYEEEIADFLDESPEVQLAFQPGTYQLEEGPEVLRRLYRRTSLLVCNVEEAARITGLGNGVDNVALLGALHELGPRQVVVTDSVAGAVASDGRRRFEVPAFPDPSPPLDRTGAGDAFAATVAAGLARHMQLDEALRRAPVNAASVVQRVGTQAGLLDDKALEEQLAGAPPGFSVRAVDVETCVGSSSPTVAPTAQARP